MMSCVIVNETSVNNRQTTRFQSDNNILGKTVLPTVCVYVHFVDSLLFDIQQHISSIYPQAHCVIAVVRKLE